MISKLKSTWIFVIMWLIYIKDVCHALDLQRYPDGITAIDASDKCPSGLEHDPSVLTRITKLHQEFWTGLGIYTQFTDWIEIVGCYRLSVQPSTAYAVSSPGLCQQECKTRYFGYNKKSRGCYCFNKNEIQLANGTNLSSCVKATDTLMVLVYEIFNGTINTSGEENELCTTLKCKYDNTVVMDKTNCDSRANIKGLCEDGLRSNPGKFWGLPKNQVFESCWKMGKLLLHSDACLTHNIQSFAWTNVFREETEVEQILGDRIDKPKFCISANTSDTGEQILNVHRQNCSTKLEWFVCKKDSTTISDLNRIYNVVQLDQIYAREFGPQCLYGCRSYTSHSTTDNNTYNTNTDIDSNIGVIAGGSVCAVVVLLIGVIVILCRIRRVGCFKNNISAETTNVLFTKSVNDEETSVEVQIKQHVNQGYGLVYQTKEKTNTTNDSYAHVQKVKRTEDTYAESTNGEYDHLHNIDGRKLNTSENTYDSNAGVRNRHDPTYDTATSSTRADTDNTYDHSFSNIKDFSEYDVSDLSMQTDRTTYDAFD